MQPYFYELFIKFGEIFQIFLARYHAAFRRLKEQKIDFPKEVIGFMQNQEIALGITAGIHIAHGHGWWFKAGPDKEIHSDYFS